MADNKRLVSNINSFTFSGTLTKDSELVTTGNGFTILNFSVANNYTQKSGEAYEQKVNYLECKVIGKRAPSLANILKKGAGVICNGAIRQERWQGQDGKTNSKVTFLCDDVEITRWPQSDIQGPNAVYNGNGNVTTQQRNFAQAQAAQGDFPEDIPFNDDGSIPF